MGVPNLPGVPPLSSYATGGLLATALLTADSPGLFLGSFTPLWGIFLGGAPVVTADSVVGFAYKQEWAISDYPVEQGSFETYDKVAIPFDARVRFSAGGSEANRLALLSSIASIADDHKNLYTVITPEAVYDSVTISHYDYHRTASNGVGLIVVDVWCFHVIVVTAASATQSPSGAAPVPQGTVQPGLSAPGLTTSPAFPTSPLGPVQAAGG